MRVYFLKLESSDFTTQDENIWSTDTIDLYSNDTYTNFSTTKSAYGSNLLDNNTWTGLDIYSPTSTSSGYIEAGRFVDTTGRIDIVSYNETIVNNTSTTEIRSQLTIFASDSSTAFFPEEWIQQGGLTTSTGIEIAGSPRYVRFQASFNADVGIVFSPTIYVRIEIDEPVMAPFYDRSRFVMGKFPDWMAMREDGSTSATPTTVGSSLINAAAGEWIDDLNTTLPDLSLDKYIGTVDINEKSWVYKTHVTDQIIYSVTGDAVALTHAADLDEFYKSTDTEDIMLWDEENDIIYSNLLYTNFEVNGVTLSQEPHHVWNSLDEIGLSVDLPRLYLETNERYQSRIEDVYKNPIGIGLEEFKLTLRRELDLWRAEGATPSSDYLGATPEILEIEDIEKDPLYIDYEGLPTNKLISIVDDNANRRPVTWGKFKWDKALWDIGGQRHRGFSTLAYRMDATPFVDSLTQSGVGDGNDLFAFHPDVVTGPREVNFKLRARGKHKVNRTEYPPIDIEFYIYGQGSRTIYNNPIKNVWLTVEITTSDVGDPVYFYSVQTSNKSNVDVDLPVSTSSSSYAFMDEVGEGTSSSIVFANEADGVPYNDIGIIPDDKIVNVALRSGKWDVDTQDFILEEVSDTFVAYFSHDSSETLVYNTSSGSVPSYAFSDDATPVLLKPRLVMSSKVTSSSTQTWTSQKTPYKLTINNASPATSQMPVTIVVPTVQFDPYVSSKVYVVELKTSDSGGVYGAYAHPQNADAVFLNYSNLYVDANNSWTSNLYKTFPESSTTSLTFSSPYSISTAIYELFEYSQITGFTGILDENGPYHDEVGPKFGNTNFNLTTLNPSRAAFGIPNSDDYLVNWIGVDVVDDNRTIAWLESNTVKPAVPVDQVVYPANAIVETLVSGNYSFGPFTVRAKLKTDPDLGWFPQIHSGYFYQNQQEYYLFAEPQTSVATSIDTTFDLDTLAYQGAPIIVQSVDATPSYTFRQIAPTWYMEPNPATPAALDIMFQEEVHGTGIDLLYAAYDDIYDIEVFNLSSGAVEDLDVDWSTTNQISLVGTTNRDIIYRLSYKVNNSFVANDSIGDDGIPVTSLTFDKSPTDAGTDYLITYEGSRFDPATPINVALNPQFTSMDEGFLFVSYNEYNLDSIELYLSPSKLIADGYDYIVASIRALDVYGNPKANQVLNLSTTFGDLNPTQVTTDNDGCAFSLLTSGDGSSVLTGEVTVETIGSTFVVSEIFDISQHEPRDGRLLASASADQIAADGTSTNIVVGKVENNNFAPISHAYVRWRKSRSLYEILNYATPTYYNGTVVADANGIFNVGPFTSATPECGYWFVSMESDSASPSGSYPAVGDVVYWYEYPEPTYGVEGFSGLPRAPIQQATPLWNFEYGGTIPPYSFFNQFPGNYDEATPDAAATPILSGGKVVWCPPRWFALPKYIQYQLGLLGDISDRDSIDLSIALLNALKDRKWV